MTMSTEAAAEPDRGGEQVHEGEAGEHDEGLQHLGQEGEADERAAGDASSAVAPDSSARTRA